MLKRFRALIVTAVVVGVMASGCHSNSQGKKEAMAQGEKTTAGVKLPVAQQIAPPENSPLYVWQQFKAALKANDKTLALTHISEMDRKKYEPLINAMTSESINKLGELTFESEDEYFYRCEVSHTEEDNTITSYPVYFRRDSDGNWRICVL